MAINSGTQWYYGADGKIYPAENNGNGAEFPMAPVGEDGREVRLVEDPALIKARTVEMLGYDPSDRQVNQNGSRGVQIRNPATGQYEDGVITADGLEMPLSLAQAQGKQIIQKMVDPKDPSGGMFSGIGEMYKEGAFSVPLMAATPFLGQQMGALTGLGNTAGSAIVGGIKSGLDGGNPLLGAGMSLGGNMLFGGTPANSGGQGGAMYASGYGGMSDVQPVWDGAGQFPDASADDAFLGDYWRTAGYYPSGGDMGLVGGGSSSYDPGSEGYMGSGFSGAGSAAANAALGLGGDGVTDYSGSQSWNSGLSAADALKFGLPLAGAILGGTTGGSKPAGTTTTTQDIPEWQKPYVLGLLNSAQDTYKQQQSNQQPGLLSQAGGQNMLATIRGDYLSPSSNPYLQATYDKAARSVTDQYNYSTMPQLSRAFGNQQAFGGSSAFGEAFGKANQGLATGLADLGTGIFGGNYQSERGRQFSAAGAAPDYASSMATQPYAGLQAYGNIVGRGFGSQTQQPYFTNPTGGAISGLLGGAALSNLFGK